MSGLTVGTALRNARKAAGLSMRDVEAQVAMSKSHLSNVENDKSVPGLLIASRLTKLYGIGLDALVASANMEAPQ